MSEYNRTPSVDPVTDELSDDVKQFWTIMQHSEELQATVLGLAGGMVTDGSAGEFDLAQIQQAAKSGKLDADLMFKISMVCEQFFWVGWHARGAVEEAQQLEDLAGH